MRTVRGQLSGLLLMGALPRLAVAALVIAVLWGGFFWATGQVGAL